LDPIPSSVARHLFEPVSWAVQPGLSSLVFMEVEAYGEMIVTSIDRKLIQFKICKISTKFKNLMLVIYFIASWICLEISVCRSGSVRFLAPKWATGNRNRGFGCPPVLPSFSTSFNWF
jgi:hypothetical protein